MITITRRVIWCLVVLLFATGTMQAQYHTWRKTLAGFPLTVGVNPLNPNSVYAQSGSNLLVSYNRGISWNILGNPGVNQIRQIIVHPADTMVILCVAFTGGIRRSQDYGALWFTVLEDYGIDGESMTFDPIHPDTMFAGNYENGLVHRSTDRGLYWTAMGTAGADLCALAVRPDSANVLLAGTGNGTISRSDDYGVTWRIVKEGGSAEIPRIVVSEVAPMVLYGTGYAGSETGQGIWKSTDGGENWFRTALHASVWGVDIDYTNPDIVYAATFGYPDYAAVFGSTDGGSTWDTLASGFPGSGNGWSIKVHPSDPSKVWLALAGQAGGVYRWVGTGTAVAGVVLDAETGDTVRNGSLYVLQTGDSVNLAQTGGHFFLGYFDADSTLSPTARVHAYPYYVHLEQLSFTPDSITSLTIPVQKLKRASVVGTVRDSINLQPLHAQLSLITSTQTGTISLADSTEPDGSFSFDSLYISHPPIVQYDGLVVDPLFPYAQEHVAPLVLDTMGISVNSLVDTADVLVTGPALAGPVTGVFSSALENLGLSYHSWDPQVAGLAPLTRAGILRKGSVLYSTGTWDSILTSSELDSLSACIVAGVHLFISGRNFVEKNDSSGFLLDRAHVAFADNSAISTCRGLQSDLFSSLVFSLTSSLPRDSMFITSTDAVPILEYSILGPRGTAAVRVEGGVGEGRLVLFGFPFEAIVVPASRETVLQRIIGYFDGSITVGVGTFGSQLPTDFHLYQNYPNPFNPTTTIAFTVPRTSLVSLKVFDLLGKEVATLSAEVRTPGQYEVEWSAGDAASGVYFYRLQADGPVVTKKLLLMK